MVALLAAVEPCDRVWMKRPSQRTESTRDTETVKGALEPPPGMLPDSQLEKG